MNKSNAFIPYYNLPSKKFLKFNGSQIGKNAYQFLYFGQFKEGLALAKLAVSINPEDSNLWALLAEAQISNSLFNDALLSIKKGKSISPLKSELYFAEGSIYLSQNKIQNAKASLKKGLEIKPANINALFQFGNIFLIEKNYKEALIKFNKIIDIKGDFWQAFNNKGLIHFERDEITLAISNFQKAILIERNAESMLALSVVLQNTDKEKSLFLAKEALQKNPNYVSFEFRKEQLWGKKLQAATEELFKKEELKTDISLANLYKN